MQLDVAVGSVSRRLAAVSDAGLRWVGLRCDAAAGALGVRYVHGERPLAPPRALGTCVCWPMGDVRMSGHAMAGPTLSMLELRCSCKCSAVTSLSTATSFLATGYRERGHALVRWCVCCSPVSCNTDVASVHYAAAVQVAEYWRKPSGACAAFSRGIASFGRSVLYLDAAC